MKIVAIAVVSVNGKLTKGNDPNIHSWTSKEDADFFISKLLEAKLIVMGSGTYEAEKGRIKPSPERLRVVLTRDPGKYEKDKIKGQLEFSDLDPSSLVQSLEKQDHGEMLLVGGSEIYASFLKENLIDALYLTVEPVIFGEGKPLFAEGDFASKLELVETKRLNPQGTLLLKYKVGNF